LALAAVVVVVVVEVISMRIAVGVEEGGDYLDTSVVVVAVVVPEDLLPGVCPVDN
jgi:hypothetical protein